MRARGREGYQVRRVRVDEVRQGQDFARCLDDNGVEVRVPMSIRPGQGGWPREGEVWLLTKTYGRWTFDAIIGPPSPIVITAPRDTADELSEQLLDAMVQLGMVVEEKDLQQSTED